MNSSTRRLNLAWLPTLLLLASALALAVSYARGEARAPEAARAPQDTIRIESRLSQLEQRFYSMEVNIRNLEQQLRLSSVNTSRGARDPELDLLRAEAETLRRRLAEIECGLIRLDERTLGAATRGAQRKTGAGDPCRLNPSAPLVLSSRP